MLIRTVRPIPDLWLVMGRSMGGYRPLEPSNSSLRFVYWDRLFATYSYHGFITDRDGETLELEADHRRHAEIENAIRDLKYGVGLNHLPSGRFARQRRLAGGTGDGAQPGPLDSPHRPGSADRDHQDA